MFSYQADRVRFLIENAYFRELHAAGMLANFNQAALDAFVQQEFATKPIYVYVYNENALIDTYLQSDLI